MIPCPAILRILALIAACSTCLAADSMHSSSGQISLTADPANAAVLIRFNDKKLLEYAFASNQFKPYVRELYTLDGKNVLRDAPPDHLHHHGLMYAIAVDGTNFWEEQKAPGVQKPIKLSGCKTSARNGISTAQFTQLVHWLPPGSRENAESVPPMLQESRTIIVTVNEANKEVALHWKSSFTATKRSGPTTLHGSPYFGLGLRLPESFNGAAVFQNSSGTAYGGPQAQDVLPANWTSVTGPMGDDKITLALFGYPKNARDTGYFFTMVNPFAYLSATQGLDKEPLVYKPGHKFTLDYLLVVYPDARSRDFIEDRYQIWRKKKN